MKVVMFVLLVAVTVAAAQFGGDFYESGVFGPPSPLQGFAPLSGAASRDPRTNTGPVVFPPSPPGNPSDSSGVVVGASGYGFVPPSTQGFFRFFHHRFYFK